MRRVTLWGLRQLLPDSQVERRAGGRHCKTLEDPGVDVVAVAVGASREILRMSVSHFATNWSSA